MKIFQYFHGVVNEVLGKIKVIKAIRSEISFRFPFALKSSDIDRHWLWDGN